MSTTVTSLATPAALVAGPPGQPDIAYAPDFEKYQARTARRLAERKLATTLPEGFPSELRGDLVWEGKTLAEASAEIAAALGCLPLAAAHQADRTACLSPYRRDA